MAEEEPGWADKLKVLERRQSEIEIEAELKKLEEELEDDDDSGEEELNAFMAAGINEENLDKRDDDEMMGALGSAMSEGPLVALKFLLAKMQTFQLRGPFKTMRRNFYTKHAVLWEERERKRLQEKAAAKAGRRSSKLARKASLLKAQADSQAALQQAEEEEAVVDPARQGEKWVGPNKALQRLRDAKAEEREVMEEQRRITQEAQARGEFDNSKEKAPPTKTKRRLASNFEDQMYIASQGPSVMFRSVQKRFVRDCMTTNPMTELERPEMWEVGPGTYRYDEYLDKNKYLPGHHLTEKPRFMIEACSAEVKTELMLPGTEHIGPGKYEYWLQPRGKGFESKIPGANPMKAQEPRSYLDDSRTIQPEGNKSPWRKGDLYVPQYHLFWSADGTPKVSENFAATIGSAVRFTQSQTVRELHERARTQPDLPGLDKYNHDRTWETVSLPLYTG